MSYNQMVELQRQKSMHTKEARPALLPQYTYRLKTPHHLRKVDITKLKVVSFDESQD